MLVRIPSVFGLPWMMSSSGIELDYVEVSISLCEALLKIYDAFLAEDVYRCVVQAQLCLDD